MPAEKSKLISDSVLFDIFSQCSSDIYFFVCDVKADYSHWSPAAVAEFDMPGEYMHGAGDAWVQRIHPQDQAEYMRDFTDMLAGKNGDEHNLEFRVRNRYGEYVWVHCRGKLRRDPDGKPALFAGVIKNMGNNPKYDSTTCLYTIHEWQEQLQAALSKPEAQGGILLFGIDGFARINEMRDYAFGNLTLRTLADRLLGLNLSGRLFRMDGDRFSYWIPDATATDLEAAFARFQVTAGALTVEGQPVPLSLTGGYVLYPNHGDSLSVLRAHLESALLYTKKTHPGGLYGFSEGVYRAEQYANALRAALHTDVKNHCANFELYYQPQYYPANNTYPVAEVLLRWHNKDFPDIGPADFIPVLESSGDILTVGRWVLQQALEQLKVWQNIVPGFGLSVNVSYIQLAQPGFAEMVCQLCARYGTPANTLCLELTESCRMNDVKLLRSAMDILHAHRINTALDDFGTGYANFTVLRALTPQWVKIDHSMVVNTPRNQADHAILASLLELAHRMKIHVCVEGIETETLKTIATGLGADFLQGYLFSRPIPAQEFTRRFLLPYA